MVLGQGVGSRSLSKWSRSRGQKGKCRDAMLILVIITLESRNSCLEAVEQEGDGLKKRDSPWSSNPKRLKLFLSLLKSYKLRRFRWLYGEWWQGEGEGFGCNRKRKSILPRGKSLKNSVGVGWKTWKGWKVKGQVKWSRWGTRGKWDCQFVNLEWWR